MASQVSAPASSPGFTAERTASLQAMVTASVAEAFNGGYRFELKPGLLVTRPESLGPSSSDGTLSGDDKQTIALLQQHTLAPVSVQTSTIVHSSPIADAGTVTRKRKLDVVPNSTPSDTKRFRRQPDSTGSPENDETSHAEDEDQVSNPGIKNHLEYSYACRKPPVTQPLGHSHLINLERYNRNTCLDNIRIADLVGTILFNHAPQHLDKFFDMDGFSLFRFNRMDRDPDPRPNAHAGLVPIFYIKRKRSNVTVGGYQLPLPYNRFVLQHEVFGYTMSTQGAWHSAWHKLSGLGKTYTKADVENRARKFASHILLDKGWDGKGYRIQVTVKEAAQTNDEDRKSWRVL